jgi:hypothetical protein
VALLGSDKRNLSAIQKNRIQHLLRNTCFYLYSNMKIQVRMTPTLKATEMSLSNETKFQAIEIELK